MSRPFSLALRPSLGLCALLWAAMPVQASALANGEDGGTHQASEADADACARDDPDLWACPAGGKTWPGNNGNAAAPESIRDSRRFHGTAYRNAVFIGGNAALHGHPEGGRSFASDAAGNRIILSDTPANSTPHHGTPSSSKPPREQTKAPAEGRIGVMALISQAGDLASGAGMARALEATQGIGDTATFGSVVDERSRYHAGSHIDTDGLSLLVGAATRYPADTGHWMIGFLLEGGYSSYDTLNDFPGIPSVSGSGSSNYFGGGMLLRRDWAGNGRTGPYVEGSLRAGHIGSDWESSDMTGIDEASYGTSTLYTGAHLGAGYVLPLNDALTLDGYAKGFWTHLNSGAVNIANAAYRLDAMNSWRTRLGLRLNHEITERMTAYAGAAWDHEFDGKARATADGLDTPVPSLTGDTGMFELGVDLTPRAGSPLSLSLGLQAYTGLRAGVGGTVNVMWLF